MPASGTVTVVGAMVTPTMPISPSVAVTAAMSSPSYPGSLLRAVCVKVAVPATVSSSGAAARVTVWAVSQAAGVNVREALAPNVRLPSPPSFITGRSTLFWDVPALTVRSASPLARATAMITSAMGWEASRTV